MENLREKWTDRYVEELIGNLLRAGVMLASAIVVLGGAIYLVRHGLSTPQYHVFVGAPRDMRTLSGIMQDALALSGRGIIQLGLLFLIATPVARVAFAIVAFAIQRDRLYVVVTVIVLAILLYSLTSGRV
ncbi:MAG: DUF1634 domain-containing protein [Terriglobia bacterium]